MATKKREGPRKPASEQQSRTWFDYVAAYSASVAWVCLVLFVGSLGYIIYAVYGGFLSREVDQRMINNLALMGKVLTASSIVGTIAFALATIEEVAYVIAGALLGLGLIFGTPMLILSKLQHGINPEVVTVIGMWTRNAGLGMCVVAGIRIIYQIIEAIRSAPARRLAQELAEADSLGPKKVKRAQSIYAQCWGLPYCHDTIREVCPAFKEHKSCWKFGRGCNCDPTMVESLIRAGAARVGKGQDKTSARTQMTQDAYLREALGAGKGKGGPPAGRTMECAKCPIYGDHQRQKFTIVNPIAIICTIGLMVLAYTPLKAAYEVTIGGMAKWAAQLAPGSENADVTKWIGWLDVPAVQVFFFAIVSLFLLAYVLRLVEWAIFVKKI